MSVGHEDIMGLYTVTDTFDFRALYTQSVSHISL